MQGKGKKKTVCKVGNADEIKDEKFIILEVQMLQKMEIYNVRNKHLRKIRNFILKMKKWGLCIVGNKGVTETKV